MGKGVNEDVVGQAGLAKAQRIAAAAQFEIPLRNQEPVVRAAQDVEALLRGF